MLNGVQVSKQYKSIYRIWYSPDSLILRFWAQGGSLNDFVVSIKESSCEKIYLSPIKGGWLWCRYQERAWHLNILRSQILIKRIDEKVSLIGDVYMLDTCNGTVIKRLFPLSSWQVRVTINWVLSFRGVMSDVYAVYRVDVHGIKVTGK